LKGLSDSNRLVRLRAGEALVQFKDKMISVFQQVLELRDRYGLHAYLTALENANLRDKLEAQLQSGTKIGSGEKERLWKALQSGGLPKEESETEVAVSNPAGSRS